MPEKPLLMIPGPTEIPWRVIQAMMRPSIAHYGPKFNIDILDRTLQELAEVFQTRNQVIAMPGSGRVGVESAITSAIEPGDRVLSVVSGVFGRWMKLTAERIGAVVEAFPVECGQPVDLARLEDTLCKGEFKALTLVHNESSTGAMYPVDQIGEIAKRKDVLYIVDAVSSLGGVDIQTDEWSIDFLAVASQKCLCAPAGLAIVSISDRGWEAMEARKTPATSFSYDLLKWKRMWMAKERGGGEIFGFRRQPFSMSVHLVCALKEATEMVLEEGLERRFGRHRLAAKAVREGAKALGLKLFADEKVASDTVTSIRNPDGMTEAALIKIMEARHGIMIAGGVEEQAGRIFRIGHMGMTAAPEYILPTMLALEASLRELGLEFETGRGVETAASVFDTSPQRAGGPPHEF